LQELDEVLGVRGEVLAMHGSARHGVVELRPRGRAPRRREEKKVVIQVLGGTKNRKNIGSIMIDAKVSQLSLAISFPQ
jgi:hypothetical protein